MVPSQLCFDGQVCKVAVWQLDNEFDVSFPNMQVPAVNEIMAYLRLGQLNGQFSSKIKNNLMKTFTEI